MTLISGSRLNPAVYFSAGDAKSRGSSFDLTIGTIFDNKGNKIEAPYNLKRGHMVQVVSAEVFNLPNTVTGHVTYKTTLTKLGIWALTIGIVDPGWKGPVTTSLLNFSAQDYVLAKGDTFLRVTLFEHSPVDEGHSAGPADLEKYMVNAQRQAMAFPETFLNESHVAQEAGDKAYRKIRKTALSYVAIVAVTFALLSLLTSLGQYWFSATYRGGVMQAGDQFNRLQARIDDLQSRVLKLETTRAAPAVVPDKAAPPPSPVPIRTKHRGKPDN